MRVGGGSARRGGGYRGYYQTVYRPPPGTVHQTTGGPPARIGNTRCDEWMPRSAAGRLPWWTPTTHLMHTAAWKRRRTGRLLAGRRRPCRASGGLWARTEFARTSWGPRVRARRQTGCLSSPNAKEEEVEQLFQDIEKNSTGDTIIMGDFNYPDINWVAGSSTDDGANKFMELIQDCFLHQHRKSLSSVQAL